MGARLKARARELGLSDTRVAERAGLAQTRYAAYAVDKYEPDLATLLRICRVLRLSPNELLGWSSDQADGAGDGGAEAEAAEALRRRVAANVAALGPDALKAVDTITAALAAVAAVGRGG